MEGYESFFQVYIKYKDYGLTGGKIKRLIESKELEEKVVGNRIYISVQSLDRYVQKVDTIRRDYMTVEEFRFNLTENARYNLSVIKQFVEDTCLELLIMDIPITQSEKYFIKKSSYELFLQEYISIQNAHQELKMHKDIWAFRERLKHQGISVFQLNNRYECQFVKKKDIEQFQEKISLIEAREALGIIEKNLSKAIKLYGIESFWGEKARRYITKRDFEFLVDLQQKKLNELEEATYTGEEIASLYKEKIGGQKILNDALKKCVVPGEIHPIMRKGKYQNKSTVYSKVMVDEYIERLRKDKEVSRLCDTVDTSDYYLLLHPILEIDDVHFSKKASLTEELWFQYAQWKLKNMQGNRDTALRRLYGFRYSTKILVELTETKEIYGFSANELNLRLFNKNVSMKYQTEIFSFLYNIKQTVEQKGGKRLFDLSKLNFKYNQNQSNNRKEKEVYSVDEYLSLYRYVSDYQNHKKLAIDDVKNALNNKKGYNKYDSTWLYVLLHMNNGWRKSSVVEFPRFHHVLFDKLNLNSIESLENIQLTYSEAEQIVRFYQTQWFQHNKNKEKATFYCSSVLTLPMAYAILICEFRCRQLHVHAENLIHFYNTRNQVSPRIHDAFFKNYNDDFKFESRKMNRTVLTYTSSVIESALDGDPIQIAQHLRGHVGSETTNIYIQLPQEHLDFITEQLFDTGYFGYIYNQVNHLLIGKNPVHRIEQTTTSIELRELLGDVIKLEDMAVYLKHLSQEREDLGEYLGEMSKEELKNRLNLINLGLSPAKEETYQCLFASCISNQIECNKCPFSIPHFYTLSIIGKRIKRTLSSYKNIVNNPDTPVGEKNKLYNLLLMDYQSILEAKQKFGTEIVEMMIDNELNELVEDLVEQPDPQSDLQYID